MRDPMTRCSTRIPLSPIAVESGVPSMREVGLEKMIDLFAELAAVSGVLASAGIPHALVGGLAYSIYVEVRATEDIDLLVLPEDWPRIPPLLLPLGYEMLAGPMDFPAIRIRRLTKIAENDVLVLDFLLADGAFADGITRRIMMPLRETEIAVAPPDVIIALKTPRMSDKDRSDIAGLKRMIEETRNVDGS